MQGHEARCKGCSLLILCTKAGCGAQDHVCYSCLYAAKIAAKKQPSTQGNS
jgi:hypothetical protein